MTKDKKFVIWGSAGHAKVLSEIIAIQGGRVIALFDNKRVASVLPGVPVYKGEDEFHAWAVNQGEGIKEVAGLAAIGGGRGRDRLAIHQLFRQYGIDIPVLRHPASVVSCSARIGPGSQILALGNVAADVELGEGCIINHHASVDHECKLGNGVHLAPGSTLCGCISVADNVFVGAGATVLPNLSIGENSIIGAGAVVTQNVPPETTVVGNPAKPLRSAYS